MNTVPMNRVARRANYDKAPAIAVPRATAQSVARGWQQVGRTLREMLHGRERIVVAVETYPGVSDGECLPELKRLLNPILTVEAREAFLDGSAVEAMVERDLTDDPVFGRRTLLELSNFLNADKRAVLQRRVRDCRGIVLIYGVGATLIAPFDVLVYADMARWEIQLRQRRKESGNLFVDNAVTASPSQKYKRAFFLDWRIADRHKREIFERVDFFLDTHTPRDPKLVAGDELRAGLRYCVSRPFRVVPFFDPGPWGGQWMKTVCDLDRSEKNFAWCFDCVPEENSLLLDFGGTRLELPSIDLVFQHGRELLGELVFGRFGNEFPIRFDFLDTMGGGNLSLQVHPLTDYIQRTFGMHYTQDESYYMLDADVDAAVFLGVKDGIDPAEFSRALEDAQDDINKPLDVLRFVNRWPAKRHDHLLIPAGTVHCSGRNGMVLEISATPYIFTFKLWDWGRMGLDGRPRPIHIKHGCKNIQYHRTTAWVREHLINQVVPVAQGDGWREERTGLHEAEFIETRRHWFTGPVPHHTHGGVNVLNLVQGEEATVESPSGAFEPFVVHYAETFIVPAAVGAYTIRPSGQACGAECATIKAFVRCHPMPASD